MDWADEKAREWRLALLGDISGERTNEQIEASLAELFREVWEESKNTNHSVCVMFDGMIADKAEERARTLAEVRRVIEGMK